MGKEKRETSLLGCPCQATTLDGKLSKSYLFLLGGQADVEVVKDHAPIGWLTVNPVFCLHCWKLSALPTVLHKMLNRYGVEDRGLYSKKTDLKVQKSVLGEVMLFQQYRLTKIPQHYQTALFQLLPHFQSSTDVKDIMFRWLQYLPVVWCRRSVMQKTNIHYMKVRNKEQLTLRCS